MSGLSDLSIGASPYPGLRPFRSDEADIFFGREEYVDHLLEKLGQNRFLAVMGPSGCGKSSLMQAGVIPALQAGFLADAGAEWRIATMRPGNHPMERLAESLLAEAALGPERAGTPAAAAVLQATLLRGPLGLVEVLRETPLPEASSLLLLVDQFEEIFRFRQQGYSSEAEADAFVELLLATVAHREVPIYVLLTMRSDFFGDCALFHDLPEAINNSQFLTPRLTRAQQQVAIEGPASVFGATIAATLVNRLLNDMGPDPDQLPLMQHVLMRMWTRKVATTAEAGEKAAQEAGITLTLADYAAIGGLSEALSWHADEAFVELDERHQRVAEVLFRCLSERSLERRDTRRPVPVNTVAAVAGVSWRQVAEVVEVFRRPDRSFLTPPVGTALHPETMLDISHESLIRQWRRMTEWVEKEARSAESYRHLEQTARRWRAESDEQRRKDYLWHGHELGLALDWRAQESPTSIWAERYGTAFDLAMAFLDASAQERETRRQQQEAAQRRKFRRALTGLIAIVIAVGIVAVIFAIQRKDAVEAKNEAVKARTKADVQGLLTEARRRPDEFGALLALQGLKMNKDASMQHQLDDALQEILGAAHFSHTLPVSNSEGIRVIAFSPNGRWLAAVMPSFMTPEDATVGVWNLRDIQSGIEKPRMRLPHTGVSALAFSPSGRFLAAGGSQALCLWDFDTLIQSEGDMPPCEALPLPSKHLPLPEGITTASLAFGPDDDKFVLGSREKAVLVWNLQDAPNPIKLGEHGSPPQVSSVAFSSDGRWVASGGQDKKVCVWEVTNKPQECQTSFYHEGWVTSVAFHPEFTKPAASTASKALHNTNAPCPQTNVLASSSSDTSIRFWDLSPLVLPAKTSPEETPEKKECQKLTVQEGGVWSIAFSIDGMLLASASDDRTVRLWDWNRSTPSPTILRGHEGWVWNVAFSRDKRWLASGGFDKTVRLWEMESPYVLRGHTSGITAVAFSPDSKMIVSGGMDKTVRLWEATDGTWEATDGTPACPSCSFSQNVDFQDRSHTDWVWTVAFSPPDVAVFASGGFDNSVHLWDVRTRARLSSSLDHETVVTAVKFSPSPLPRPLLITTERGNFRFNEEGSLEIDGKLHLWDVTFLKQDNSGPDTTRLSESQGHLEKVSTEQKGTWAVAFSHDGQSFITGGGDGSVKLWDLDASADRPFIKQREQFKYPPHKGLAWTIDFNTQNGIGKKLIASGGIDTTIHLQDVDSGDAIVLGGSKGHKGWVTKVVFSSDGQWLASGGSDGTVRLWNVSKVLQQAKEKPNPDPTKPDDLEPEAIMRGHEGMVRSLAFSPDDRWLVSGGGDQILRLWRVQQDMRSEAIREEACKRVWRENITAEELKDIGRDPQEGGWWPCRDNVSPHSSTQPTPARQTAK